jgi:endonuclease/exonuclease/phosphatase family metal-dependent hydrolase
MIAVKNDRKLSKFNRLMLWLNYFVVIILVSACFAKYISPLVFWLIAFAGLAFPFVFLANLAFMIYWLAQFRRMFFLSLVAGIFAYPTMSKYLQFNNSPNTAAKSFRITSYNSMLFDLYNWRHNKETRAKIFSNLADIDSDIICFQEFYTSEEKGDFNNIDSLTSLLNLPNYHAEYTTTLRTYDHWGIATFSRFPIVNEGKLVFNTRSNNMCIYTDVVIRKDTVRIYNVHLQSISFSKKDNQFLEDIKKGNESEEDLEKSKNVLRRLKRAFTKRAKQVAAIKTHMATCKYKIILCGDFNDTAASYAYKELSEKLSDAFVEKGVGLGRTYAGEWPQFRIDYILYDEHLACNSYSRAEETFTDHYPITAHLYFSHQ